MLIIQVALVLTTVSSILGHCPSAKILNTGNCSYRIHCYGYIGGIRLPAECMEASNDPRTIDVTLTDAIERYDDRLDIQFLSHITTLRVSGIWPQTLLSLLQFTLRLENLFLSGNQIDKIGGRPLYYLGSLRVLDLSHNKLTEIDNLFRFVLNFNKLKKLNLSHNNIHVLTADDFVELTALNELDLSYNFIENFTHKPFSNLISLEILRLDNNYIINLNDAVNNLHHLKHFYVKGNRINHIEMESLKMIPQLETFDGSFNNLERLNSVMLSRHFEHLGDHSICKIILSGNHITSVPNATMRDDGRSYNRHTINVLTQVDLSANDITNIEYNAFHGLENLTLLNLSKNKLISFTVNADDVAYVKFLNLSGNYISQLCYESFSHMVNLQELDLSNNHLEIIPDRTFDDNYNLNFVNMSFNALKSIDGLHINMFHSDGGMLDLSNNQITNLVIPYGEGLHLTVLILSHNNINNPSEIDLFYQTDLKNLDLSHNQISELQDNSLRLPVSLTLLDLSYNKITRIAPSAFTAIHHLETLRLAHNHLDYKSIEFGSFRGLSSLLNLDLSYNRITNLDSKFFTDLKSLSVLTLSYNGLDLLRDEAWYGHKNELRVILDGNYGLTCEWVAFALKNADNGFSKMRPTVQRTDLAGTSLGGIPCTGVVLDNLHQEEEYFPQVMDERLLLTLQKILEAVKDQTLYLRKLIWRLQENTENAKQNFNVLHIF